MVKMLLSEQKVLASMCRASFFEFLKEFWHTIIAEPPIFNWHVEYLCSELQEVAERVIRVEERPYDLVINIPPGSTKSTIASQMFPAWVWTRMGHAQFICVSYSYSVALKDSLKTRDIVESEAYQETFPGIQLREDSNTKGLFVNTKKGFRLAAGVMGAITGQHGHFLLVDDPLNPEQSYSEAELKSTNRWMRTTLPSRRIPKHVAPIILIQQRLNMQDPTGEMLERYAGRKLKHICLPGEDSQDVKPAELRARYVNGLLDPVRLSKDVLQDLESELGPYGYAAQVLQNPVPLGGGMIEADKINYADEAPELVREVRSWDKAGTEGGGKFSAGIRMGKDKLGRYWVTDVQRGQWGSTKREDNMRTTAERDGDKVTVILEIEGGSGGKESGEHSVRNLDGFIVHTFHPTGDKPARAYPFASQVGGGNVFVLRRHWTKAYVDEMRYFPYGKFSDQVDATSGAFNFLARKPKRVGALW
jgi:predicted phage terminase large subunit-like protein